MLLNLDSPVVVAALAVFFWLLVVTIWLFLTDRHYRKLVGRTGEMDLKRALEKLLAKEEEDAAYIKKIEEAVRELEKQGVHHVQKVGIVRFNPFSETGGDQSFSLAVLDGENSGVVITGLHARESTRLYIKPIKGGKSRYELSREEKDAIVRAQKA